MRQRAQRRIARGGSNVAGRGGHLTVSIVVNMNGLKLMLRLLAFGSVEGI